MGHTYTKNISLVYLNFKFKCTPYFYLLDLETLFYSHTDILSPPEPNSIQYSNDVDQPYKRSETLVANVILLENIDYFFIYVFML